MRVTIIVEDKIVLMDGEAHVIDDVSELTAAKNHAIQWHGEWGEIEYITEYLGADRVATRKYNERFDDFSPYEKYVQAWEAAKVRDEGEQAKRQEEFRASAERSQEMFRAMIAEEVARQLAAIGKQ